MDRHLMSHNSVSSSISSTMLRPADMLITNMLNDNNVTEKQSHYQKQFQHSSSMLLRRLVASKTSSSDSIGQNPSATSIWATRDAADTMTLPMPGEVPPQLPQITGVKRKLAEMQNGEEQFDSLQSTVWLPMAKSDANADEDLAPPPKRDRSQMSARELEIHDARTLNLSHLPSGVTPSRPDLVGFKAGESSDSARTNYFLDKRRPELLSVLSLCDQLRPQLLVDIMVSISKRHPNLPIFDSPDWNPEAIAAAMNNNDNKESTQLNSNNTTPRRRHGHTLINPRMRQRHKSAKKSMNRSITFDTSTAEEGEIVVIQEDSIPASWPQAGQGLYAKLPPENEDNTYLVDENDEAAFSHFVVDNRGKLTLVSACA